MRNWLFLLSLLVLSLAGCVGQAEPQPTQLPTAIPPGEQSAIGDWAISFSHEFPADAWAVGTHRYQFFVHCPIIATEDVSSDWVYFDVIEAGVAAEESVYFRLAGLSTGILAPINLTEIQAGQKTTAVITFLGVTEHVAEMAAENCDALVRWDDKPPQVMTMGDVFIP